MTTNLDEKRRKAYGARRAIMDYGMGATIASFGVFFLAAPYLQIEFAIDPVMRYLFSGLCLLYGGFRIYRGYKKNYFNE
jgi:hypothetical protein